MNFWFNELEAKDWFAKNEALDADIEQRFGPLRQQLAHQRFDKFLGSPRQSLAAVILFDQMSRNLFRGDPRSFATDELALAIAHAMVERGWDKEIGREYRVFVYLPFEHSENLDDQNTAVELIDTLGNEEFSRYAHAHRDVIARFGRFPHRNAILKRGSTPQEDAYLSKPGSGF